MTKTNGQSEKNHQKTKEEAVMNLKKEFTVGISAMIVNTLALYLGIYLFSLLYKAGAENALADPVCWTEDAIAQTYFVQPVAGIAGILLVFALKNFYDLRFFHIQRQARNERARIRRALEWVIYVLVTVLMIVLIFLCFSCGKDFFDDYTFESAGLGNVMYTILYFVVPLLYAIHAIIRVILKKAGIQTGEERPMTRAERRREERGKRRK